MFRIGLETKHYVRVLHIIVSRLEELVNVESEEEKTYGLINPDHRGECQYLLQTLSNLMSCLSQSGWITLVSHAASPVDQPPHDSPSKESKIFQANQLNMH